jgi:oxepin-CoA hydrolase/3-oxo-5,6-dehydrosuberyl-CoA semialdehyde dehydrogenase
LRYISTPLTSLLGYVEKLAPAWLAGMPAIVKPATATAQLTQVMVKAIVDSGLVPDGAISLIRGGAGDLLDNLDSQDVTLPALRIPDSNCACIRIWWRNLCPSPWKRIRSTAAAGDDVTPEQPEFALFIREVVREMTTKAGQKCTAIRRIIVPQAQVKAVSEALIARLQRW